MTTLNVKYNNHLSNIKDRLCVIDNFMSHETCDALIDLGETTRGFMDRSIVAPILGVHNKDIGKYNALRVIPEFYPDLWNKHIKPLSVDGFPVSSAMLNKYEVGEFLPPHRDKLAAIYTVTVPLQDEPNNHLVFGNPSAYYDNIPLEESDSQEQTISYPDKKGTGYCFHGNEPVHWVPPVTAERYTMLCFFGSRVIEGDLLG